MESLGRSLDEPFAEATQAAQPPLDLAHPAIIALVVVSEEVKEAMECKDPKLIQLGVPRVASLASGDPAGDDDFAESGLDRRERLGRSARVRASAE